MKTVKSFCTFAISFCFTLVVFVACNTGNDPEDSKKQLIPLAKGNSWSYVQTTFDTIGRAYSPGYYVENKVISDTMIANEKWYHSEGYPNNVWLTNRSNGFWQYVKAGVTATLKRDTMVYVFSYPAKIGDKSHTLEVVSIDKEVTVPAGTFRCIHYLHKEINSTNYLIDSFEYFVVPGLGIIKWQQVGKLSGNRKWIVYKSELTNYSITNP